MESDGNHIEDRLPVSFQSAARKYPQDASLIQRSSCYLLVPSFSIFLVPRPLFYLLLHYVVLQQGTSSISLIPHELSSCWHWEMNIPIFGEQSKFVSFTQRFMDNSGKFPLFCHFCTGYRWDILFQRVLRCACKETRFKQKIEEAEPASRATV